MSHGQKSLSLERGRKDNYLIGVYIQLVPHLLAMPLVGFPIV